MEFQVLGSLEVTHRDAPVSLGGPQQQTVLAVLLAHVNKAVSTDRLIDEVWGESPPDTARKAVQSYVAQLRKALNLDEEIIHGEARGYVAEVKPGHVDSLLFEELIEQGRPLLRTDPDEAARLLREALGLWRGIPFFDLGEDVPSLRDEAVRLEDLHVSALEDRIEADLLSGSIGGLSAELDRLVAEHPYRERLRALQMLALYRSGRQTDALRAYELVRRTLAEDLGLDPSPELQRLEQRILDQDPLLESADPLGAVPPPEVSAPARNPYKGLRPFGEGDSADFFGRADLVRRLVERLGSRDGNFLALVGPSGSGKSSVLWAGLVPSLASGALPESERWRRIACFPGTDPFGNLAEALTTGRAEVEELAQELHREKSLPERVFDHGHLLVLVDQLEELFALSDPIVATEFLEVLAAMAIEDRIHLVVTLRADFMDQPLRHPHFAAPLEQGLVVMTPLQDHEIRAAIVEPAASVGVRADPDLVAAITTDVAARPAALPLMQYALTDVFDRRRGDLLTMEAYSSAGGILGALSQRASDIYNGLDEPGQEAARQVFLRLIAFTDEAEALRRRVGRTELDELPFHRDTIEAVLETFGQHRLLTFDRDPVTGGATVEVAHEALLREWPRLRTWIEGSRDDLRIHRKMTVAAADWRDAEEDPSYLAAGPRLAQFESVATGPYVALTRTESEFLAASHQWATREQRRVARRRRITVGVLSMATVVALAFTAFAFAQRERAEDKTALAEQETARADEQATLAQTEAANAIEQTQIASARELAAEAIANLNADPQLSIYLALAAIDATQDAGLGTVAEAEEALHLAVQASRLMYTIDHGGRAAYSPDGTLIATAGPDTTARIWRAADGELLDTLDGHDAGLTDIVFARDNSRVVTTSLDGTARVWDIATTEELLAVSVPTFEGLVTSALDGRGDVLATGGFDGTGQGVVRFYDVPSGALMGRIQAGGAGRPVRGLDFSPDGSLIAFTEEAIVILFELRPSLAASPFDIGSAEFADLPRLVGHTSTVTDVVFAPDGRHVATTARDGTVRLWDLATGETVLETKGRDVALLDVDISADGSLLAAGAVDGLATIWDTTTGAVVLQIAGHPQAVESVAFSPDGAQLVTSGRRGEITSIWDITTEGGRELQTINAHEAPVAAHALNAEGSVLVTTDGDAIRVWNVANAQLLQEIAAQPAGETSLDLSPDGTLLATAAFGGGLRTWEASPGSLTEDDPFVESTVLAEPLAAGGSSDGHVAINPDGSLVARGAGVELGFFELSTGETRRNLIGLPAGITAVTFDESNARVAAGYEDGSTVIWDLTTGEQLSVLAGQASGRGLIDLEDIGLGEDIQAALQGAAITAIAFSPDGSHLVTGSDDGTAIVWDTVSGEAALTITSHAGPISDVAFDDPGRNFYTAGSDGFIRRWDIATGNQVLALPGVPALTGLTVFDQGRRLAAAGSDGAIRFLVTDSDELVRIAEARLVRSLTEAECQRYLGGVCPQD